jgi:CBS domain-containing protein
MHPPLTRMVGEEAMLTLRDIMTPDPVTVGPETTLRDMIDLLSERSISGVPVVTGSGQVVGVVSASDVLEFASSTPGVPADRSESYVDWGEIDVGDEEESPPAYFASLWSDSEAALVERINGPTSPEWDILEEHAVDEVMTRRIITMPVDTVLSDAADRMIEAGIHRLLVTDGDRLVGLVSSTDFVRAIAKKTRKKSSRRRTPGPT